MTLSSCRPWRNSGRSARTRVLSTPRRKARSSSSTRTRTWSSSSAPRTTRTRPSTSSTRWSPSSAPTARSVKRSSVWRSSVASPASRSTSSRSRARLWATRCSPTSSGIWSAWRCSPARRSSSRRRSAGLDRSSPGARTAACARLTCPSSPRSPGGRSPSTALRRFPRSNLLQFRRNMHSVALAATLCIFFFLCLLSFKYHSYRTQH